MSKYIGPKIKLYKIYKINLYLKLNIYKKLKKIFKKKLFNKVKSYFYFQLKEKQKLKIIYGVLDKQFYNYYLKSKHKNINILILLELRLDNILYRTGIFSTRKHARQIINHKYININNNVVTIPSYQVNVGDLISFKKGYKFKKYFLKSKWIFINYDIVKIYLKRIPYRNEFFNNINEKLILDFYNK